MTCTKCGKPIKFIRTIDGKTMAVDDLLAYVVPSEFAYLTAVTPSGYKSRVRIATIDDKKPARAYLAHGANCKTQTPKHMIAAREEYDRRQRAVIDAKQAFQAKQYEETHRFERQKRESMEKVEQMSLYSYL